MGAFDPAYLIGKPLDEARDTLKSLNMIIRIIKKDNKYFKPSKEYKDNRVNIHSCNNIVTEVFYVG